MTVTQSVPYSGCNKDTMEQDMAVIQSVPYSGCNKGTMEQVMTVIQSVPYSGCNKGTMEQDMTVTQSMPCSGCNKCTMEQDMTVTQRMPCSGCTKVLWSTTSSSPDPLPSRQFPPFLRLQVPSLHPLMPSSPGHLLLHLLHLSLIHTTPSYPPSPFLITITLVPHSSHINLTPPPTSFLFQSGEGGF